MLNFEIAEKNNISLWAESWVYMGPILLTWINFNPSMDK